MPREASLNVVVDTDDDAEFAQFVAALESRDCARAVCRPTPGITTRRQLAQELLVSLGKRFDTCRHEHRGPSAWDLAELWIEAEGIEDLFVVGAHLMAVDRWRDLVAIARSRRVCVWLVVNGWPLGAAFSDVLRRAPCERWDKDRFRDRWAGSERSPETETAGSFPSVPGVGFPVFRAACRRLLDQSQFDRVDRVYCRAMDDTLSWIDDRRKKGATLFDQAAADEALQRVTVASCGPAETLVRLRAAQVAFLRCGLLLTISLEGDPRRSAASSWASLDRATADRVRHLCDPRRTAALALALATDASAATLRVLDLGSLSPDGAAVSIRGRRYAIPGHGQALVRALLITRREAGADEGDPLFLGPQSARRMQVPSLSRLVRGACSRVGIALRRADVPWAREWSWGSVARLVDVYADGQSP